MDAALEYFCDNDIEPVTAVTQELTSMPSDFTSAATY